MRLISLAFNDLANDLAGRTDLPTAIPAKSASSGNTGSSAVQSVSLAAFLVAESQAKALTHADIWERILREVRSRHRTYVSKVILHPSNVCEIQIKKEKTTTRAGQYIFLCVSPCLQ